MLMFLRLPGALSVTFGIIAFVIFLYATIWYGSYLGLRPGQWALVALLALLAWIGTVVYLLTRKPAVPLEAAGAGGEPGAGPSAGLR